MNKRTKQTINSKYVESPNVADLSDCNEESWMLWDVEMWYHIRLTCNTRIADCRGLNVDTRMQ